MQSTAMTSGEAAGERRGRRRRSGAAACLLAALVAIAAPAISAGRGMEQLDITRAALAEWVDIRRLISQERRDWGQAKELLNRRIAVVKTEIEGVKAEIDRSKARLAAQDMERVELDAENDRLKQATSTLAERVNALEARTRMLLKRLPEHVTDKVKVLTQRLPRDPDDTKLSLSVRFQNVVGILNEINKANREIVALSEVRKLPDGTSSQVTTIYVGLGQAYYVGGNDTIAGYGVAAVEGWTWKPANDIAPQVAQAVKMLKNEQVASFVQLPVKVQ